VLVVSDQEVLVRLIRLTLRHGAFAVRAAATAAAAEDLLAAWRPQLAVVELEPDPAPLLRQIGRSASGATRVPVLALTRRGDLKTTLAAFAQGVDDVLAVPFPPEEFLARVLAVLRRLYRTAVPFAPAITVGALEIDILHRRVRAAGSELHLTPLEQNLLYLLAANSDRVLTREEILDSLWGTDFVAESNVVDRHVRSLRAKLQNDWRRPRFVVTVPGRGYRFLPADVDGSEGPADADGPGAPP
jgi:two-component system KDP operon response regulator KdpE